MGDADVEARGVGETSEEDASFQSSSGRSRSARRALYCSRRRKSRARAVQGLGLDPGRCWHMGTPGGGGPTSQRGGGTSRRGGGAQRAAVFLRAARFGGWTTTTSERTAGGGGDGGEDGGGDDGVLGDAEGDLPGGRGSAGDFGRAAAPGDSG